MRLLSSLEWFCFIKKKDIKEAGVHECSYPLIYYTINDYESADLQLEINQNQFLCVELSVIIPTNDESEFNTTEKVKEISVSDDRTPFPLPKECFKIILFQGAVSAQSLFDVYSRKEGFYNNSRVEYLLMKGPHQKGQCQGLIS